MSGEIMGKGASKLHASPLVIICKQRKEFIKSVMHCRFDLVTSFVVYLESLLELDNALNQFLQQQLVIFGGDSPSSHFSSQDSHLDLSSFSDSDSDLDSLCQCEKEEPTVKEKLHTNNMGNKEKTKVVKTNEGSSNVSTKVKENTNNKRNREKNPTSVVKKNEGSSSTPIHVAVSRDDHHGHHEITQKVQFCNRNEAPQQSVHHQYVNHNNPFDPSLSFSYSYNNNGFLHYGAEFQRQNGTEQINSTPPPPQVSTWDFLNPFSINYDDVPCDHDYDDDDEKKIREREGIPDLEDVNETDQSKVPVLDEKKKKKKMESGVIDRTNDSGNGNSSSNVTKLNSNEEQLVNVKETSEVEIKCKEEVVVLSKAAEEETLQEEINCIETSSSDTTPPVTCCRKIGLKEAVVDVRNEFKYLVDCGKEFLTVIEVGKLPYHPARRTKLKCAFASCVMGLKIPSYMLQKPVPTSCRLFNADMRNKKEHVHVKFGGDLSSTLEKLYVWEEKLYEQVLVEEKLRILYDKQYKRLKNLDDRGCEPEKIEVADASVKLLDMEINVAVASISAISRKIDELRDNKLLPELIILIKGLITLWSVMSACHQKQFQAISNAKGHIHIIDPGIRKKSKSSRATLRLERVALKWGICFKNFMNTHKTFLKHLNDWLLMYIPQEQKTEDGVIAPFSPSDITKAPPIFKLCNKWYKAIHNISEDGISKAISNFASSLGQLYEKQEEEHAMRVRVEFLFEDYKHRVQSFCKKNGIKSQDYSSAMKMKSSEDFVEAVVPLLSTAESDENFFASARGTLVEQRKRHKEVIRNVNDFASSCLQEGLSPIFEALGNFSLENVEIHKKLSLLNSGSHE